jgi:hypothetical protein
MRSGSAGALPPRQEPDIMPFAQWCHWLQNTPFAAGIRQSDLMFPLIEGSHILALSFSVGLIVLFDLRLLRLALRQEPASRVMQQIMPWALPGFAIMFVTGALLFVAQAEKVYANTFFRYKMLFLVIAGLNAAYYQVKFYPKMPEWDLAPVVPRGAKVTAAVSLLMWAAIITLGRTMAYEL